MAAKLCILACHNLWGELCTALAAEDWPEVVGGCFPAHCGRPPLSWDELRPLIPDGCTLTRLIGGACLAGLGEVPSDLPMVRKLPMECFHAVADPMLVAEALAEGAYLVTPGWLADWRGRLAEQGFTPDTAGEDYREFARSLLLLDTGITPAASVQLEELAAALGLQARRVAVGLGHLRGLLAREVLSWRLEEERRDAKLREQRHAGERADQVMAMEQLAQLASARIEAEAIATIEELFRRLCAPSVLHYLKVEQGRMVIGSGISPGLLEALERLHEPYAWTPSGRGFLLRISSGGQVLGLLVLDELAFPEHRERYLNLALAMTGVCALAIENARAHKMLIEAEKMASLGVLVAGMAHEINTPAGVGLIAASSMEEGTERLAERFSERSMTHSDLRCYLEKTKAEVRLVRANLDRIACLVEAFRQVAIGQDSPGRQRFRLRACIEDVVASMGGLFVPGRVELQVECDANLELDSYPQEWSSILGNLLTNSVRHGFKGRAHGVIQIAAHRVEGRLELDYQDDGLGLADEALARIFDPFFTTDLQKGMGLGMHLVYNLVTRRLNGTIACENPPGGGAHFHIEVPQ